MGEGGGAFERVGYVGVDLVGGGDRARGVNVVVPDLDDDGLRWGLSGGTAPTRPGTRREACLG